MNDFPSWTVKCHLMAGAHVSAVGMEVTVRCMSERRSPRELESPWLGLPLSPDGDPTDPREWAQDLRGREAWDGSPCVLVDRGCERSSRLG